MKKRFNKTSQCNQDAFAYQIGKDNGTYIEIGGWRPKHKSNTYALETFYNWRGFTLELNKEKHFDIWNKSNRTNPIYWEDAITFDYASALNNLKLSNHITYLQCDIEPPKNTFKALQQVINQGITFDCCTFEHEEHRYGKEWLNKVEDLMVQNGYKVAVYNVSTYHRKLKIWKHFETWFVKDTIDFTPINWFDWMEQHGYDLPQ